VLYFTVLDYPKQVVVDSEIAPEIICSALKVLHIGIVLVVSNCTFHVTGAFDDLMIIMDAFVIAFHDCGQECKTVVETVRIRLGSQDNILLVHGVDFYSSTDQL
jgi:hypothetical protein